MMLASVSVELTRSQQSSTDWREFKSIQVSVGGFVQDFFVMTYSPGAMPGTLLLKQFHPSPRSDPSSWAYTSLFGVTVPADVTT